MVLQPRLRCADRKSLLLGTALASTLLIGSLLAPTPAAAVACIQPASPNPIIDAQATFITCVNTEPRTNAGNVIDLQTTGIGSYIDLYNSGILSAYNPIGEAIGIVTITVDANSPIDFVNTGGIALTTTGNASQAFGILARTYGGTSPIDIVNSGGIAHMASALQRSARIAPSRSRTAASST
jgi:autotransporter family porin